METTRQGDDPIDDDAAVLLPKLKREFASLYLIRLLLREEYEADLEAGVHYEDGVFLILLIHQAHEMACIKPHRVLFVIPAGLAGDDRPRGEHCSPDAIARVC